MASFEMVDRFGHIYHRYLNDPNRLSTLIDRPLNGSITAIAEGDVCWYEDNGDVLAVMFHPDKWNRIPPRKEMENMVRNGLVPELQTVLQKRYVKIPKVLELKTGTGSERIALRYVLKLLNEYCAQNYWIDAFSPRLLSLVKDLSPETPTSLHTRLGTYGPCVIKTAFEIPPVSLKLLETLDFVDAVTVTYKYSPARPLSNLGYHPDRVHRWVYQANKELILGGVEEKTLAEKLQSGRSLAVYCKW